MKRERERGNESDTLLKGSADADAERVSSVGFADWGIVEASLAGFSLRSLCNNSVWMMLWLSSFSFFFHVFWGFHLSLHFYSPLLCLYSFFLVVLLKSHVSFFIDVWCCDCVFSQRKEKRGTETKISHQSPLSGVVEASGRGFYMVKSPLRACEISNCGADLITQRWPLDQIPTCWWWILRSKVMPTVGLEEIQWR